MKTQFSLIIACYNEEECLKKTVEESVNVLTKLFKSYEIILIDDKSLDKTPQIMDALAKKYPSVKLVHNVINLGQGITFLIGCQLSKGDYIMQNGADRPFAIHNLEKVMPLLPKNDIVIIARADRSAYSLWRKVTSVTNNLLRGIFFGFDYNDLNFVQVYKKKVIRDVTVKARSAAFVTQEIILKAHKKGYKIKEIELPYFPRTGGLANHGKQRDILWAIIDFISFWVEEKIQKV